jgi:hypothetical protein
MPARREGIQMRRCISAARAAVFVGLLLPASVGAQTAGKPEAGQARSVKGQVLTSTSLPPVRIRFARPLKYVGSQSFILYETARAEQHFFVDADKSGRIRRMYMLQFEGRLPGVEGSYNYPVTQTVNLGGQPYLANSEAIASVSAALKANQQSDVARAASFLESKGYRVGESIVFQRFVRLVDEAKRNEFILLYVEDAGAAPGGEKAVREISDRALKGFTVLK